MAIFRCEHANMGIVGYETRSSAVAVRPCTLRATEFFAKSLKIIQNDTVE